jgi:hypothetical protein
MQSVLKAVGLSFLTFFPLNRVMAVEKIPRKLSPDFAISDAPGRDDWRFFMNNSAKFHQDLWLYYKKQGKTLADWSWGWRLGWVDVCFASHEAWCWEVYKSALMDSALVVRSEAAVKLGTRFRSTGNARVVDLLTQAYQNPENIRNSKPLFVQHRILFALREIGGKKTLETASRLAQSEAETAAYWKKIR